MENEKTNLNIKPGWGERLGYGSAGLGMKLIDGVITSYLLIYMTNIALLDVAVISAIIAVSKIFDGVSDLYIGNIIDHTESKLGRARIWLLRMCIPYAVSVMLLFWVPPHFPVLIKYIYIFLIYNIVNTVMLTFLRISHYSLISLISSDREEHGLLSVINTIFTNVGGMIGGALFVKLLASFSGTEGDQYTQKGYTLSCLLFCIIGVIAILITVFSTRERVAAGPSGDRSIKDLIQSLKIMLNDRCWVAVFIVQIIAMLSTGLAFSGGAYYAQYVLHDMGNVSWIIMTTTVPVLVIQLVCPALIRRISKKTLYMIGILLQAAGILGFALASPEVPVMMASNTIKGLGVGITTCIVIGIVADMVSKTESDTGRFRPGSGFAGLSAAQKLGSGLGSVAFGFILSAAGFNGALEVQPAAVPAAVTFAFLWLPMILLVISVVIFQFFFDLDDNKEGKDHE